jgi:UDP-2,3-diacylglucosamine pyrophosphatase LpxH
MANQVIHTAADGKKYLVIHGHQADGLTHFNNTRLSMLTSF